jgi:hypothetical protein
MSQKEKHQELVNASEVYLKAITGLNAEAAQIQVLEAIKRHQESIWWAENALVTADKKQEEKKDETQASTT